MQYKEYSGKTVEDAITNALVDLGATSDQIDYEVIDKGSVGLLGIGSKPAVIKAAKVSGAEAAADKFLSDVFATMGMEVEITINYNEAEGEMYIDLAGDDMGILIGKRGQTLDSLQYLTGLVVNKDREEYIRIKIDIENYRERRQETLINLAHNLAYKAKRTHREIELEPMNPNERRVIHAALQNDKFVTTRSEGEEPYRHVVIFLKREKDGKNRGHFRDEK